MKAVTFSYDDGVTQDRRLVEMFNRYGLKGTFNLNSGGLGKPGTPYVTPEGKTVIRDRISPKEVKSLYRNHEVAVHTVTHPNLTELPDDDIVHQVEDDRLLLSELCGYDVVGMAYPCGGVNHDDRVVDILRQRTSIRYARTIHSTHSFALQSDLLRFSATLHHTDDRLFELGEQFVALKAETPQLFYIWGHSYEFDMEDTWDRFEEFCRLISGHSDVFYGTNAEILL